MGDTTQHSGFALPRAIPPPEDPRDIKSLLPEELTQWLAALGEPPFRAKQLFEWLHRHGAQSFEEMSTLKKAFREKLAARYRPVSLKLLSKHPSDDGTIKFVFETNDNTRVESVFIPVHAEGRNTLCVSTQVGCAMGCTFCYTATLKLHRHLSPAEIVDQVYLAERVLIEEHGEAGKLTNLVYMGMGEPLHNFDATVKSIRLLLHRDGRNFSRRHITVSTSGLVPLIDRLGKELNVNLAVSLNATTDEVRNRVMPVNKAYPIAALLDARRRFPLPKTRRITFEYVLLAGENDTLADADRLTKLLRGIPSKVNLLAWNEVPGLGHQRPADEVVDAFRDRLIAKGFSVFTRTSRGRDVAAACGMLGGSVGAKPTRRASGNATA